MCYIIVQERFDTTEFFFFSSLSDQYCRQRPSLNLLAAPPLLLEEFCRNFLKWPSVVVTTILRKPS